MDCAHGLARSKGLALSERRPLLLVTDFNHFRRFVLGGHMATLATPNITARHIDEGGMDGNSPLDKMEEHRGAAHASVFRDVLVGLYLMSRASCMLTSRSGFSKAALWMADNDLMHCHRDWEVCQQWDAA